ncbi:hypothetical protein TNCV_1784081, partial [Trichonephila clavipes]
FHPNAALKICLPGHGSGLCGPGAAPGSTHSTFLRPIVVTRSITNSSGVASE